MRSEQFTAGSLKVNAVYPDEVCFVYNPNYLDIEAVNGTAYTAKISVGVYKTAMARTKTITAKLYANKARIYLSRLFELLFEEPSQVRSLPVRVEVTFNNVASMSFHFDTIAVWGNLQFGERFNAYGVFAKTGNGQSYQRTLVWFRKFPFKVSLFRYKAEIDFYGRYDGGRYSDLALSTGTSRQTNLASIDRHTSYIPGQKIYDNTTDPRQLIFFEGINKLYATNPSNMYFRSWDAREASGILASSECLDSTGTNRPSTNCLFIMDDSDLGAYRYDGTKMVRVGVGSTTGFLDVIPVELFNLAQHSATIRYKLGDEDSKFSVFDSTFDYTFFQTGETMAFVNLIISDDTAGHYLRWIDRQGCLQYYLFTQGERVLKNTIGKDAVALDTPNNGMYFANDVRIRSISGSVTCKACAVHLSKEIYDYVESIATSPIIDLYLGKNREGVELWRPVTIEQSSVKYDPTKMLHDIEITFALQDTNSQTL